MIVAVTEIAKTYPPEGPKALRRVSPSPNGPNTIFAPS